MKQHYTVIGIDPGMNGGVVVVDSNGSAIHAIPMPLTDERLVDVVTLQRLLVETAPSHVAIEQQHIRGHQGGAMKIGENYGRLTATFDLCDVPFISVFPKEWQAWMYEQLKIGPADNNTKAWAIQYCDEVGFDVPMTSSRKNARRHDGIADAYCIARYSLYKH